MAKKQTRRSISVSRSTYERLKAFCEANNISMSQFVETRVGDFLGQGEGTTTIIPTTPRPTAPVPAKPATSIPGTSAPKSETSAPRPVVPTAAPVAQPVPMTSAAARYAGSDAPRLPLGAAAALGRGPAGTNPGAARSASAPTQ